MKHIIKVGYLLSYDYQYIFNSLKLVYPYADKIVICYDKDNKTWSGNQFTIPNSIFEKIKEMDSQNKIEFYSETFYIEGEKPLNLDTRQRNMLAQKMENGGWHIQIDSDEYPIDFRQLTLFLRKHNYLLQNPKKTPINFFANLVVLFKNDTEGFFVVKPYKEKVCFITNNPQYEKVRTPKKGINLMLDYYIIHQTWARSEEEISHKFQNWGHRDDFNTLAYFELWKNLNPTNYTSYKNFHPLTPEDWQELEYIKANNIDDLIEKININNAITLPLKWTKRLKLFIKSWL